ncbi:MAG: hypothetical protein ACTHM8_02135 [Sphingomonas sp.]
MTLAFTDPIALAKVVRVQIAAPAIVGVDGWAGVGKTTLAESLAGCVGGASYDLDAGLIRNQGYFVGAIRTEEIARALQGIRGLIFVSGICLRQVLANVGVVASAHIYIKRMAEWGWADEDELVAHRMPEIMGASGAAMREELRHYHRVWEPHLLRDFEFHRFG